MMLFTLALSCMLASSLACSNDHCKDPVLANQLLQITFLPNKEELKELCPKVLTFMECEKDFMECPGQSLDELTTSSDKAKAGMAKSMIAGIDMVRDVCNENSSFHKDYVASVICVREYFIGTVMNCVGSITKPLEDFFNQRYADADEDENERMLNELRCLREAFEVTCIVNNIGDACGQVAQRTMRNGLERMKDLLGISTCKNLENATDLKLRFLNFLELDEQRRNNVQGIFDLFKRRR